MILTNWAMSCAISGAGSTPAAEASAGRARGSALRRLSSGLHGSGKKPRAHLRWDHHGGVFPREAAHASSVGFRGASARGRFRHVEFCGPIFTRPRTIYAWPSFNFCYVLATIAFSALLVYVVILPVDRLRSRLGARRIDEVIVHPSERDKEIMKGHKNISSALTVARQQQANSSELPAPVGVLIDKPPTKFAVSGAR
jgi:hypothetical protein